MYSKEQKDIALRIYHQTESVTETIRILGYPTRRNLYTWIAEENTPPKTRKEYPVIDNPPDHPRNPPLEVKLNAIHRCYELGENIKYVSEDIGYSRASIYQWRKRYLKEGTLGLMNHKNITPGTLVEGSVSSTDISSDEINQLKAQIQANEKWLTDITEFAIPAGKVYLSPIVDCFDGLLVNWNISTSPDALLVNSMLDDAAKLLSVGEKPIIHSDRGVHYRWPGWIDRMEKNGFIRSMSKKGCSPDNSACEGVFGRIKNEMFYNADWSGVNISEFIGILNDYLYWYNEKRIKKSLGYLSPIEYRHRLGLVT
jgi:transposase InsO family protein